MSRKNGNANGSLTRLARSTSAEPLAPSRLSVLKTYKIYIGGKFPRSESGRTYQPKNAAGEPLANVCDCSRKDFRDAVVAARAAQNGWADRTAYNRGQILYRIAEMLEGRAAQFVEELHLSDVPAPAATNEVQSAIDCWLHYAGWCDKYQQVFSSVNPVSSSHFNFSVLEPAGVVSVFAPEESGLLGLSAVLAPIIAGGNTCVALASNQFATVAITLAEVLATSDLPGGVVNLLTGRRGELADHFASHMDVNAFRHVGDDEAELTKIRTRAALNVKRVVASSLEEALAQHPYQILDLQEVKTTWHPIGV